MSNSKQGRTPAQTIEMGLCEEVQKRGGVARLSTLYKHGYSESEIRKARANGVLIHPRNGWVALPGLDAELRFAVTHGVLLSCVSLARRNGLWVAQPPSQLHVASRHPGSHVSIGSPGSWVNDHPTRAQVDGLHPGSQVDGHHSGVQADGRHSGAQAKDGHPGSGVNGHHSGSQIGGRRPDGLSNAHHPDAPASAHRHGSRVAINARVHWKAPLIPRSPDSIIDSLPNTLHAIAHCLPREQALAVWESALNKNIIDRQSMNLLALSDRARSLLDECRPYSDSGLETLFKTRLRWLKLSIRAQTNLLGRRVDFLIGDRLVVQIDGKHHNSETQRSSDYAHDTQLLLRGYHVIRVSYTHMMQDWPAVQESILEALAQGWHLAK